VEPLPCPPGTFCPAESAEPTNSPESYYQPSPRQDFYIDCRNGTYCPAKSEQETQCPAGLVGTSRLWNKDVESGCMPCDPGYHSPAGSNECVECEPGYVCVSAAQSGSARLRLLEAREAAKDVNITGARLLQSSSVAVDQGYTCPPGYWCPPGSDTEKACPAGTYQPLRTQSSSTSCQACAAGTYSSE